MGGTSKRADVMAKISAGGKTLRNLVGADLSRLDLMAMDLGEADLRGARLIDSSLVGADLREANLTGANLLRADLRYYIRRRRVSPMPACRRSRASTAAARPARCRTPAG